MFKLFARFSLSNTLLFVCLCTLIGFTFCALEVLLFVAVSALLMYKKRTKKKAKPKARAKKKKRRSTVSIIDWRTWFLSIPIKRLALGMVFALLLCTPAAYSQGTTFDTPETLLGSIEVLYGALIILGGYLSAFIPLFRRIDEGVYRVLAFAIITGIGFFMFGTPIFSLAITYAISTSLYEIIIKWFLPSPKPSILPD